MNSFVYMVANKNNQIFFVKQQQFNETLLSDPVKIGRRLQHLLVEEPLFKSPFSEVLISYSSPAYTLVPNELFSSASLKDYLAQITFVGPADKIGYDRLTLMQANLVFAIDKGVQFLFEVHFPKAKIHHFQAVWLNSISRYTNEKKLSNEQLFIHVNNGLLQVALLDQQNLRFVNHFLYDSIEDFRYFIFLMLDQFKLSQETTPLHLSGNIDKQSKEYKAIYPYLEKLYFIDRFLSLTISSKLDQKTTLTKKHFDLMGLAFMD